jgi:hypothetical protein
MIFTLVLLDGVMSSHSALAISLAMSQNFLFCQRIEGKKGVREKSLVQ